MGSQPQLFRFTVDFGQIIITVLMAIIGYLVKRTIDRFDQKISQHEEMFFKMNSNLQRIMGRLEVPQHAHYRKEDMNQS